MYEGTVNASGVGGNQSGFQISARTTVNAPSYAPGVMYFDLTLNKLKIGGATAFEVVTSA
jgi:hypothetical protein